MQNMLFLCHGCGSAMTAGSACSSCGAQVRTLSADFFRSGDPGIESDTISEVPESPRKGLDHLMGTLDRWYPDRAPVEGKESSAMRLFMFTCSAAIWFGIVVLGLVALFFASVVGIAIYQAM